MNWTACPFCKLPPKRVLRKTGTTLAFFDRYPVTEGHPLVIPKWHVVSVFELPPEELTALWAEVATVRKLDSCINPGGQP